MVRAVDFAVPLRSYSFLPLLGKCFSAHFLYTMDRSAPSSWFLTPTLLKKQLECARDDHASLVELKLARFPTRSPLALAALPSVSLLPAARLLRPRVSLSSANHEWTRIDTNICCGGTRVACETIAAGILPQCFGDNNAGRGSCFDSRSVDRHTRSKLTSQSNGCVVG
jgi:hypothetical protein